MKRILIFLTIAAFAATASAQVVTLKFAGGGEATYRANEINYIDFTPDTSYVDLGLSVLWAKCNLGATSPEAAGYYYSWGETARKTVYADTTYQFASRNAIGFNVYRSIGRNIASTTHDAATAALGGKWRMPTHEEVQELIDSCRWEWGKNGSRSGYWITGPRGGARMFLPAAGYRDGKRVYESNKGGYYWTDTYGVLTDAFSLNLKAEEVFLGNYIRWQGRNIRPVRNR